MSKHKKEIEGGIFKVTRKTPLIGMNGIVGWMEPGEKFIATNHSEKFIYFRDELDRLRWVSKAAVKAI